MLVLAAVLVTLSAPWVDLIAVALLPAVNNLITKLDANNWVRIFVSLVTAFLAALLTKAMQVDGSAIVSTDLIVQTAIVFFGQMLVHLGIYKSTGLHAKFAPAKGIG